MRKRAGFLFFLAVYPFSAIRPSSLRASSQASAHRDAKRNCRSKAIIQIGNCVARELIAAKPKPANFIPHDYE
jgi:hypothetical protein